MNSCLNEVVDELDMLLLLICTMGILLCEVVVWIGEVCAKLFMWRTKMNFWYMRLMTEFVIGLVESFGRKRVFRVRSRCLSVFANKRLCEVLENDFWDGWGVNLSVDYDRTKCQESVGENDTKIRLTVWILCAKWWKRKNGKKVVLPDEHGRACAWHGPCVHSAFFFLARLCVLSGLRFLHFLCLFTHFCFELAFGVNIKVLDNFVNFPMSLVWLEKVFWTLSYDENTLSGSLRNFKET